MIERHEDGSTSGDIGDFLEDYFTGLGETRFSEMVPKRFALQKDDGAEVTTFDGRRIVGLIRRCGTWAISEDGIESLTLPYFVDKQRIHSENWIMQICQKPWVVGSDFIAALKRAWVKWPNVKGEQIPWEDDD